MPTHGTISGARKMRCRCRQCREVVARKMREARDKHRRRMAAELGVRMLPCPSCGAAFLTRAGLHSHEGQRHF